MLKVCACVFVFVLCVCVHLPAFLKVGWYDGLVERYMSAFPDKIVANTTCHLPRSDAFSLFRDPVSGDLPWPGLVFGLTVLATWVWCTDQVTSCTHKSSPYNFEMSKVTHEGGT